MQLKVHSVGIGESGHTPGTWTQPEIAHEVIIPQGHIPARIPENTTS